jgi:hypothetical protein
LHWGNRTGDRLGPAKLKTKPRRLDFDLGCANPSADHRIGMWGELCVEIAVMAHCIGEIARRAVFGLQNRKPKTDPCGLGFGRGCVNPLEGVFS